MRKWILPGVLGAMAAAGVSLWWKVEGERRDLEARLQAMESARPPAQPAPAVAPPAETAGSTAKEVQPSPDTRAPKTPVQVNVGEYLKTIEELRAQLTDVRRQLNATREETTRLEARAAEQSSLQEKLSAQIRDLQEDVQLARRTAEALDSELKVKTARIVKSEAAEKVAQERLGKAEAALAKAAQASKEMEDLNRRREMYLTSLLRRFREVTDLYRGFTLDLQNREQTAAGTQAGDLSRIQNSIQQAEDDLRQLQSLNIRAAGAARQK